MTLGEADISNSAVWEPSNDTDPSKDKQDALLSTTPATTPLTNIVPKEHLTQKSTTEITETTKAKITTTQTPTIKPPSPSTAQTTTPSQTSITPSNIPSKTRARTSTTTPPPPSQTTLTTPQQTRTTSPPPTQPQSTKSSPTKTASTPTITPPRSLAPLQTTPPTTIATTSIPPLTTPPPTTTTATTSTQPTTKSTTTQATTASTPHTKKMETVTQTTDIPSSKKTNAPTNASTLSQTTALNTVTNDNTINTVTTEDVTTTTEAPLTAGSRTTQSSQPTTPQGATATAATTRPPTTKTTTKPTPIILPSNNRSTGEFTQPVSTRPTTSLTGTTTEQLQTSQSIGGIDKNIVIIGAAAGALLLIVIVIVVIFLCKRRKRHAKSKRILPPSSLPFSPTPTAGGGDNGESPATPTHFISERTELIHGNGDSTGGSGGGGGREGGISMNKNNGVVAYRKEDEYIAIWEVGNNKPPPQPHGNNKPPPQPQQQQQQQQEQQQPKTDTRVDIDLPDDVKQRASMRASFPLPSTPSDSPKTTDSSSLTNRTKPTAKADEPLTRNTSNTALTRFSTSSSKFGHVNDGFEECQIVVTRPNSSKKRKNSTTPNHDPTASDNVYNNAGEIMVADSDSIYDHPPRDSGIDSFYADQPSEQNENIYDDVPSPLRKRPNGDASRGNNPTKNSNYVTPSSYISDGNENIPKSLKIVSKTAESDEYVMPTSNRSISNSNSIQSPESPGDDNDIDNYENTRFKRPDTYLAPTDFDDIKDIYDNFCFQPSDTNDEEDYYEVPGDLLAARKASLQYANTHEMTMTRQPSNQSPTHIETHAQNKPTNKTSVTTNNINDAKNHDHAVPLLKSTSLESDETETESELYETPLSLSEQIADNAKTRGTDSNSNTNKGEDMGSPELNYVTGSDNYVNPSSASDNYVSPSSASDNYVNPSSASDNYVSPSSASDNYVNPSSASDMQDYETDEAEYHTPRDISNSPFLKDFDAYQIKQGSTMSLPTPVFSKPPPRPRKPIPLEKRQNESPQATTSLYSLENTTKNTPQNKNIKSLTLGDLSKRDNPKLGKKKALIPLDKSSPLLSDKKSLSVSCPGSYDEEDPSNVYLTPRESIQATKTAREDTERPVVFPKPAKRSMINNSLASIGTVNMNELHNAMKKKGLNKK